MRIFEEENIMRNKFMSWLLILTLVVTMLPMTTAQVAAAETSYDGVKM